VGATRTRMHAHVNAWPQIATWSCHVHVQIFCHVRHPPGPSKKRGKSRGERALNGGQGGTQGAAPLVTLALIRNALFGRCRLQRRTALHLLRMARDTWRAKGQTHC